MLNDEERQMLLSEFDSEKLYTTGSVDFLLADDTDGDVETEIDILELVEMNQAGGAGKFNPAVFADELIANFERDAAVKFNAPIVMGVGHPAASAPAAGHVLALRKDGTRVKARVRVNADFVPLIRKGIYKHVSPEFRIPYTDAKGEKKGAKLIALAITNLPFQRGHDGKPVGTFHLTEVPHVAEPTNPEPRSEPPMPVSAGQENTMDDIQIKALVAEETKGLAARLSEAVSKLDSLTKSLEDAKGETAKQVASLSERVETYSRQRPAQAEELAERDARIAQLTETNSALRKGLQAKAIREAVEGAEKNGVLSPAMRDKWFANLAEDPVAALAASPFSDVSKFIAWCAEAPVVVPVSSRQSAGSATRNDDGAETPEARAKRLGIPVARLTELEEVIAASRG